jgi:hypothetical protein
MREVVHNLDWRNLSTGGTPGSGGYREAKRTTPEEYLASSIASGDIAAAERENLHLSSQVVSHAVEGMKCSVG